MGYIIAMAGKGGTGKTTVAACLARLIAEKKKGSVLAVDADPNSNLGEALGLIPQESIGSILDKVSDDASGIPSGMTKDRFVEFEVHSSIVEGRGIDLLTMGKTEGPGCYCYVNNILRSVMARLISDYDYIIIDNEAGLEHLSRRTTRKADLLLVVSDPTAVGLKAAARVAELAGSLKLEIEKRCLLLNRYDGKASGRKIKETGLAYLGGLPYEKQLEKISLRGDTIMELKGGSKIFTALEKLGDKIWKR